MNTSVYLKPDLAARVDRFVKSNERINKNQLITVAIEEFLEKHENTDEWSPEFLAWEQRETEDNGIEIDRTDAHWREIEL